MQNLMPQLDLPGKMVQQPKASQSSRRTGKKSGGDDDFRDLLENSSKGDGLKEKDSGTVSGQERPEKTEVKRQEDTAKKGDTAKDDPLQEAEAGMQAFRLMLMGSTQSEDMQIMTDLGSVIQQPETEDVPQIASLEGTAMDPTMIVDIDGGSLPVQGLADGVLSSDQLADLGAARDLAAEIKDGLASDTQIGTVRSESKEILPKTGSEQPRETVTKGQDAVQTVSVSQPQSGESAADTVQQPQDTRDGAGTDQNGHPDTQAYAAGNIIRQSVFQRQFQGTAETVPTVHVRVSSPQELINDLLDQLKARTSLKEQGFEIQLHPENLGRLAIKVAYTAEKVSISIVCSNERTMELLSSGAKNIAQIMEENLGAPTTVMVEQGENDYLEQYNDQEDPRRQQQEQREEQKKPSEDEHQDFLQQLRLGLI